MGDEFRFSPNADLINGKRVVFIQFVESAIFQTEKSGICDFYRLKTKGSSGNNF